MNARYAVLALKALAVVVIAAGIAVIPRFAGEFRLSQFTFVAIYFIGLVGLQVLTGYSGQISLGHGAFMGIGAYTAGVLMLGREGLELGGLDPPGWLPIGDGMEPVFAIPIAGLVAGLMGYAFGVPALRLAGVSLALATFAVAVSLPALAKRFDEVTGGGGGLVLNLPETPFGLDISVRNWLYYQAWVTAGILALIAWLLLRGRAGRALRSLRDGEVAAVSSGVSPAAYKTFAFGFSSAYAGVAGALLAIEIAYVNPDTFPALLSIQFLASLVVGGLASLYGALIGAFVLEFLPFYAQDPPVITADLKQAPAVVFGVVLILVMFVAPSGIVGLLRRLANPVVARFVRPRQAAGEHSTVVQSRRAES